MKVQCLSPLRLLHFLEIKKQQDSGIRPRSHIRDMLVVLGDGEGREQGDSRDRRGDWVVLMCVTTAMNLDIGPEIAPIRMVHPEGMGVMVPPWLLRPVYTEAEVAPHAEHTDHNSNYRPGTSLVSGLSTTEGPHRPQKTAGLSMTQKDLRQHTRWWKTQGQILSQYRQRN
ncbi:hypothetical protein ILYODFUR_026251 [Ilyodon furcidens]|uniref:Uncharacterized protein n=1 Tax=Ilyodon furcidens TaxID=33524 RepID=A0ABV0TQY1_9TELE